MHRKVVGIGEMEISDTGILSTYGLGSCIGVIIYDTRTRLSGLIHLMLPDSNLFTDVSNPLKFVDTGVPLLINELVKSGSDRKDLKAKIAGGASLYSGKHAPNSFNIGKLNIMNAENVLKLHCIDVVSRDIGGRFSRSIDFHVEHSKLEIKRIREKHIEKLFI